jgi:benzoyl-CoA reductase/2-hydroxyglutaryl-CoA dehydratase subunit BcrC/BadD/HgdB
MKDLKHLIYFEKLLENTDNELIEQAKKEGKLCIGWTCYHMAEVILNVDKCFSVRLRAPNTGSMDIATYYMSNYTCEYCRALLERGYEGGLNFLDGMASVDACAQMNRCAEQFEVQRLIEKPGFFITHADIPYKVEPFTIKHYTTQMRNRVLNTMRDNYGVDISDDALRDAVRRHNEVCKVITEIGELRKADNPVITGYEYHVLNLVS